MAEGQLHWLTRPRDDSATLAQTLANAQINTIIGPVMHIVRHTVQLPREPAPAALLLTSRHAAHALADIPAHWRSLPTYCVGGATAQAAAAFAQIQLREGPGDVEALLPRIAAEMEPGSHLLYLAGDETRAAVSTLLATRNIAVTTCTAYEAQAEPELDAALLHAFAQQRINSVSFFSPRSARLACTLMQTADLTQHAARINAYCLSLPVAQAAGHLPWAGLHTCPRPSRQAMVDLIVSQHAKS
jgi:uroporphyrinogen-III synthase